MAGMGLVDALNSYQQGVAWKQNQEAVAREQKQRELEDAANARGAAVIDAARRAHEASQPAPQQAPTTPGGMNDAETAGLQQPAPPGAAPTPFKPTPALLLKAYEARGTALAEAGDFKSFAMNEAKAAPLRQQIRTETIGRALQEYEADTDPVKLIKTVYDTAIFDGKTVKDAQYVRGGKGGQKGAPSGPDMIRVTLSDGSTKMVNPLKVKDAALAMLRDPATQAELAAFEFKERLKAAIDATSKKDIESHKGDVQKGLEDVKAGHAKDLAGIKAAADASEGEKDRKSAEKRAGMAAAATRYSADKGLEAAGVRQAGKAVKDDEIMDALTRRFGATAEGAFGKTRMADQGVADMATSVREILDANPGLDLTRAIDAAAKQHGVKVPKVGLD